MDKLIEIDSDPLPANGGSSGDSTGTGTLSNSDENEKEKQDGGTSNLDLVPGVDESGNSVISTDLNISTPSGGQDLATEDKSVSAEDDSILPEPIQITLLVLFIVLLLVMVPLSIFLVKMRRANKNLTKEKARHFVAEKAVLRKQNE